ncbi:MAG: two-component system response regulator NarL [Methyloligellaceae bacterium]
MTVSTQTVLIIDDHPLFRKGANQLLGMDAHFEILGEAASGAEGIKLAVELTPDLILLDLDMKGMNGIQTLTKLREEDIDSLIIVLTVSNAEDDLLAALRSGADGYLLKDMEPEEILLKLKRAGKGQIIMDDTMANMLALALREEKRTVVPNEVPFTGREEEILRLIAEGLSNKLIGRELGISDGTVKVHVKNLLRKLNLNSRLEAAVWALANNFGKQP